MCFKNQEKKLPKKNKLFTTKNYVLTAFIYCLNKCEE